MDGGRVKTDARVQPGQMVRVPPVDSDLKVKSGPIGSKDLKHSEDGELLARMLLHEDDKVFVFNKPAGIAVQGGSGVTRHIDGLLEAGPIRRVRSRVWCTASTAIRRAYLWLPAPAALRRS